MFCLKLVLFTLIKAILSENEALAKDKKLKLNAIKKNNAKDKIKISINGLAKLEPPMNEYFLNLPIKSDI